MQNAAASALDKEYEMLLDALGFEPVTPDTLAAHSGGSCASISSALRILGGRGGSRRTPAAAVAESIRTDCLTQ